MKLTKLSMRPSDVTAYVSGRGSWYMAQQEETLIGYVFVKQQMRRERKTPDLMQRTTVYFEQDGSNYTETTIAYPFRPRIQQLISVLVMLEP